MGMPTSAPTTPSPNAEANNTRCPNPSDKNFRFVKTKRVSLMSLIGIYSKLVLNGGPEGIGDILFELWLSYCKGKVMLPVLLKIIKM